MKKSTNTILLIAVLLVNIVGFGLLLTQDKTDINVTKAVTKAIEANEMKKAGGKENYDLIQKLYASPAFINNQKTQLNNALKQTAQAATQGTTQKLTDEKLTQVTNNIVVKGKKDAKFLLVEYTDIECPACKSFHASKTIDKVLETNGDDIKVAAKHFPLSFHKNAQPAAEAVECAKDQSDAKVVYAFLEALFATKDLSTDNILKTAKDSGLDDKKIKTCMESGKKTQIVKDQMSEGTSIFNVRGTPTLVLINTETGKYKQNIRSHDQIIKAMQELK